MMDDWITYYVMSAASLLGNFVSLPIFVAAAVVIHKRLRARLSALLVAATVIALVSRFARWTPLAQTQHHFVGSNGQPAVATGPNALGTALEIIFRADVFVIAVLALCLALTWKKSRQGDAQP